MNQISKLLRDFLWGGGKGNQHRMHLVNWEIIKRPLLDGGLQFKDPELSNIAMEENFYGSCFLTNNTRLVSCYGKSTFMVDH